MTPDEYSQWRRTVDLYPKDEFTRGYYALGLTGEAGEVADKVKKFYRDGTGNIYDLMQELGDTLWYLTALADDIGFSLQDVINLNVKKLKSRHARGMTRGEGDNR